MRKPPADPMDTRLDDATVLRIATALRPFGFFEEAGDAEVLALHHSDAYDQGRLTTRWDAEATVAVLDGARVATSDTECVE
ncbi:MAG TPA: hypothetical protein VNX21_01295 [Candidatus Thermoplasmatota archaeon]|nr:hypothetical protein [Candidatus Thermoplasmatota archaeon]